MTDIEKVIEEAWAAAVCGAGVDLCRPGFRCLLNLIRLQTYYASKGERTNIELRATPFCVPPDPPHFFCPY
jgi:hypothetical protein